MADVVDFTEKFKYMNKRIEDLEIDAKELRQKSEENENGKILLKMQVMFDIQREDAAKKELRDEKKEEKRDLAIAQIGINLNAYTNRSELLIIKVDSIAEKVTALENKNTELESKVNSNSEKTKIDTSLWFKALVGVAGLGCLTIIGLLIRKWLNI